jgi:hypothetical protein
MQIPEQKCKLPIIRLIVLVFLLAVGFSKPRLAMAAQTVCTDFVEFCTANGGTPTTVTLDGKSSPACECSGASDPEACALGSIVTCLVNCEPILDVTVLNQTIACVSAD